MSSLSTPSPCPCPATPATYHRVSLTQEVDDESDIWQTPPQRNHTSAGTRKRKTRSPRRAVITPTAKFQKTRDRFESVLDRPFIYWKKLDAVLEEGLSLLDSSWKNASVRGQMIHHLVHFLELKVGLDLYRSECLLLPTTVLDQAWRTLVLETELYQKITYYIQDFHGKPRKTILYASLRNLQTSKADQDDKLRRTQSLFQVYFMETMPESISREVKSPPPPVFLLPRSYKNPTSYSMVNLQQPMFEDDDDDDDLLGLNLIE
jgi:hypothetical protein